MENYILILNNLFNNITNIHNNTKKVNTRQRSLTLKDVISYSFLMSYKNTSKGKAIEIVKKKLKIKTDDSCFQRKLNNVSVDFFKNLYSEINNKINDIINETLELQEISKILTNNYVELKDNDDNDLIPTAVDGMCSNKIENGKLTTKEDLFIYNIANGFVDDICCDNDKLLYFHNNVNNESDKNGELNKLIKFIELNHDKLKNKILIMDRLYSSYKLFIILKTYNIKYIIRMKDCLDLLKPIQEIKKSNQYYKHIIEMKNDVNIKIVNFYIPVEKKVVTKTNEVKTIKFSSRYHLITNLGDIKSYSDDLIKKLYKSRWNIEVNNKKIKENFKFETFYGNDEDFVKQKYISLINEALVKFIILVCGSCRYKVNKEKFNKTVNKRKPKRENLNMTLKKNKDKIKDYENEQTYEARININFSKAVDGFYSVLLLKIINGNLDIETLNEYNNENIKVEKYKSNRSYERRSIVPYTKWYIKMYHKKYEYEKIIDAIVNDTIDKLNKNLKTKALEIKENLLKITIIKI